MQATYTYPKFGYTRCPEQEGSANPRHAVVIVGAGPIGLTAALDLAARGVRCVVLDDNDTVSVGSRAVCYAKRPLEIFNRLGVAGPMVERGVNWKVGRVFFDKDPVYRFDLLPEPLHEMPAMINLQQYHLEEMLVRACQRNPNVELRWKHQVTALRQQAGHAVLTVNTPEGPYTTEAQWVLACDGANSSVRGMVGARFSGQFFHDRFLIADVVMKGKRAGAGFPTERWFWFDPPFHRSTTVPADGGVPPSTSVLLHRQPEDVWRIDFQLGWQADPEEEKKPEKVVPRIQAMLGPDVQFDLEWVSVYQFACRRIDQFRYGRVLFAGDSAHQVSPFGARGANTGIQDVDNLAWKLALVLQGAAPESLVDSYHDERAFAADDNLRASTRSTDFITPKSRTSLRLRNAVLELAHTEAFARPLVNSGRLSTPTPYVQSALNTPDESPFSGSMHPGTPAADAPVTLRGQPGWLLHALGAGFNLLSFGSAPVAEVSCGGVKATVLQVGQHIADESGMLTQRYDGQPGTVYLMRPDQHVAARWRQWDTARIQAALQRCLAA